MKKRWLSYILLGLACYLGFLIISLPATWLAWALARTTEGTVALDQIHGSLWQGGGRLIVYYPKTQPHYLGQADWRVRPWWLFMGVARIELKLSGRDVTGQGSIQLSPRGLSLQGIQATAPAQVVNEFYSPASLFSPRGQLRISADSLRLDDEGLHGTAEILWQQAGSKLSQVHPLGDYQLNLIGKGKTANIQLKTLKGDLELTGTGQWQVLGNGQFQVSGTARPRARQNELEPLLSLMGNNLGNGRRAFRINTRIIPGRALNIISQ